MKLTQEQLAELIAKVFANLKEKVGDGGYTMDDILAEVSAILGESGGTADGGADAGGEGAAEGGEAAGAKADPEVTPDFIAKVLAALDEFKSADGDPETKEEKPAEGEEPEAKGEARQEKQKEEQHKQEQPAQRKYANIFLTHAEKKPEGFKSRLEAMGAAERRKTAYGMFGRAVKCINASHGDMERAAHTADRKFNDKEMAREFKALTATSPSDGGYLVPEVYSNEIIELLYPSTVIYELGARRLGMPNGNLNIPKIKAGTRAKFNGEDRKIPKTTQKYGNLKLSAKKLTALIPMSNDLLRSTNFDNDVIVGQDITQQMALGVDYGALMGTGGQFQPLGVMENKNVKSIDVTGIGAEYASAQGVLTAAFPNYMVAAVLKENVYAAGLGFVFNTSVEQFFKSVRDNAGSFIFADEMNHNGTLAGYRYKTTNLIETVNGKTKIVFGNWNDLIIGEQGALEIETSREGSWTDDAGNMVSAFENDQTLIRAINNVDAGLRHEESFAVATKVSVPV
ncbi:MAG: phage major capsid protein [Bacteroidales bacterium]|nr:phage major capsid protein [Bacteroidales bacterium]